MPVFARITYDPDVMGGRPCIRGLRVTVGIVVGLVASGHSHEEILRLYPYLTGEDICEAMAYTAWRGEELEMILDRRERDVDEGRTLTHAEAKQRLARWLE